ncbi:hypothetical protein [Ruminococcus sp. HUN007]|uniref:hypothetical protein n=1 Tax=Ruminococcus sp. HUN007 TaxID=1514668 RepID=UPI0005D18479|nr:hypothetical protein [Ruminococcus sp. HUN007]
MLYALEAFYNWLQDEEKEKFASDIAESGLDDNFSKLMYMVSIQNYNDFSSKLIEFIEQIESWNGHYSEVFYLAIKHKVDISVVVNKIDLSDLRNNLQIVLNCHDDYAQIVLDYGIPESFTSSIKGFRFITDMYELACYKNL